MRDRLPRNIDIIAKIAEGGSSHVFKGYIKDNGLLPKRKVFAIKALKTELLKSLPFIQSLETEYLIGRNHALEGLVRCYEFQSTEQYSLLVMDFIEGKPVNALFDERASMRFDQKIKLIYSLCETLKQIHSLGIIHGDIKPSNVIVLRNWKTKLIDFGLASAPNRPSVDVYYAFSTLYSSPQKIMGLKSTYADDVYSFGALTFRILFGCHPFAGRSSLDALRSNLAPAEIDKDQKDEIYALINSCISFDASRRPRSAIEVYARLNALLNSNSSLHG